MKKKNDKVSAGVKEIARLANVSIATVDRVIHKREGVSEKTKARIEAIIQKLNYQPNILAQRLALASRGTIRIAALLPNVSEETEFWQAPLDGIDQAAGEIRQYNVHIERFFFDQNDRQSFFKQVRRLSKTLPDGVLLSPIFPEESMILIRTLEDAGVPYIMINSEIVGFESPHYIGPDIFHSGYLAAQLIDYCIDSHQQVLVANISGDIDNNYAVAQVEDGLRAYFKDHRLPNTIISLKTTQTDYPSIARRMDKLLRTEKNIGAILVTNSRVSGVAKYLEKTGISHITLLGYDFVKDNVDYLKRGVIDFLICEKPQEQGYRGIMALFQHLVYSNPTEKKYLMPIDIITKENCEFYRN
ncbi:MAG: substrate-binding domain-containing protein [Chitinophagaceae bacterium]|nr:substrate-binding domain-containing protein [Chitinophagaceae bacterium]